MIEGEIDEERGYVEEMKKRIIKKRKEIFKERMRKKIMMEKKDEKEEEIIDEIKEEGIGELMRNENEGIENEMGEGGMGIYGGKERSMEMESMFMKDEKIWEIEEKKEGMDKEKEEDVMERIYEKEEGRKIIIEKNIGREKKI